MTAQPQGGYSRLYQSRPPWRSGCSTATESTKTLGDLETGRRRQKIMDQLKGWPTAILEGLKCPTQEHREITEFIIESRAKGTQT